MKRLVVVLVMLAALAAAGVMVAAAQSPTPDLPGQVTGRDGFGKIIAIKPPGNWQQSGGPADFRDLFGPLVSMDVPVFGTDINIGGGNETVIVSNPANPLNFLAGANSTARFTTTNGGTTWNVGSLSGGGDPAAAFDSAGRAYFAELGNTSGCPDNPLLYKSTDGGLTFGPSVQPITDPQPLQHFFDKEWVTVDNNATSPYQGRIYFTASNFNIGVGCNLSQYIDVREQLVFSTDQGATWSSPTNVNDASHDQNQFTNPVAARDGTLYVGYQYQNCTFNCSSSIPMMNLVAKSTNGGVSFSPSLTITGQPISSTGAFNAGYQYLYAGTTSAGFRHNDQAIIGVSPTNANQVYAVWTDGRWDTTFLYLGITGRHSDIAFSRSTDGGATWTPAIRINDDAEGNGKDQFFPWMTVGSDGTIHASWMDRRDSATGFQYREYYSQSTNGGDTWSTNQAVGDTAGTPSTFIGDYSGIAVNSDNTLVLPIWTDMRSGQRAYTDRGVINSSSITSTPTPTNSPTNSPTFTPTATNTSTSTSTPTVSPCGLSWRLIPSANVGSTNHNRLTSIAMVSATDAWAVGHWQNGDPSQLVPLIERWDGSQWSIVNSPSPGPGAYLTGVAVVSANDVWAVGSYPNGSVDQTLTMHWNGTQWSIIPSPNPGTASNHLYGVATLAADDVWAVGAHYDIAGGSNNTLTMHWNGTQWSIVPSPSGVYVSELSAVAAIANNDVWAVGSSEKGMRTLTIHWDGSQWSNVINNGYNGLLAVTAVASNDVWAVGISDLGHHTLSMHWNGSNWSTVPSANPSGYMNWLSGVTAISSNDVWAVGRYYDSSGPYRTLVEHWNGAQWSVVASPNSESDSLLSNVDAISAANVLAVGNYNDSSQQTIRTWVERYSDPCPSVTPTRTATAIPTPCPINFSDVHATDYFYDGVVWLYCHNAISGYNDGTFKPYNNTTRGQMTKIVVLAYGIPIYTAPNPIFKDVPTTDPFYQYIETAAHSNIVSGYNCGGPNEPCPGVYFRPGALVTRGQLSKIVVVAAGWSLLNPPAATFKDVASDNAFYGYIETAYCHQIISGYDCGSPGEPCPGKYFRSGNNATRGQIAKIVYSAVQNLSCASPPAGDNSGDKR